MAALEIMCASIAAMATRGGRCIPRRSGEAASPMPRYLATSSLAFAPGRPTGLISARAFFQSLYGGTVHELAELPCQRFGGKRLLEKRGSRLHEATADYFVTSVGADK